MNALNPETITLILLGAFLLSALGVILIGVWIYRHGPASKQQQRISRFVVPSPDGSVASSGQDIKGKTSRNIGLFRNWINNSLSSLSSEKLQIKISSAYWKITDTEFILLRILAVILAFLLGWLIPGNILGGIFLSAIAILVPPILLDTAITKRQKKFRDQLLDVLILIKGSVQAGYSLFQALDLAVKEIPAPASEEFGRILYEMRFGVSLEGALFNLAERMQNDDLQIVVTAIIINSQVGGNLSTVLESAIDTIRDRMHLMGEIQSLTSYGRYVGNFLTLLPFIAAFAIFLLSPDYFDTVFTSLLTQIIFVMALLGVIIGNIWIRRIIKIKV